MADRSEDIKKKLRQPTEVSKLTEVMSGRGVVKGAAIWFHSLRRFLD